MTDSVNKEPASSAPAPAQPLSQPLEQNAQSQPKLSKRKVDMTQDKSDLKSYK